MITSQQEILTQGKRLLTSISVEDYTLIVKPQFISSIGAHMRHIFDHYCALIAGTENGIIDYDIRHRGSNVESCPLLALAQLKKINTWLDQLSPNALQQRLMIKSEVSLSEQKVMQVSSTLARELLFVSSHTIHHYAMINLIEQALTSHKITNFGIAPATASYLRKQHS